MSEHSEESVGETLIEKANEAIHHEQPHKEEDSSSSSSDSETDKPSFSLKVNRLFGRQKPVHAVLGGGKPADVLLWREKKMSASILAGVTVIWFLFEWLGCHLLALICYSLILSLAILFLWSNASTFIHKSPPKIPEVILPEDLFVNIALALRFEINRAFIVFREIALGRDLKEFLLVIAGFWILSVVGSWCNFLTLFYLAFIILHTVPVLYEKHEDRVDALAEKAAIEMKKRYAVLDAKVLQKLPRAGTFKDKKHQ